MGQSSSVVVQDFVHQQYLNTPLKHPQTQNQFRQVVKYSIPSSQDSFEDEIDGLFFSVGYGRIFSWRAGFFVHGRFVDMFHVDKWSILKLPFAHVVVPWCRMLQPACPLPWKETREELLRKFCTWSYGHGWMMYFWKEETWLKDTHQKKELNLAHWVTIYRYMHMSNRYIFHHFPWWPLSIFGAARITFIVLWGAKLRCRVVLGRTLGGLEGWWWGWVRLHSPRLCFTCKSSKCHPFARKGYDEWHVEVSNVRISMSWF